MKKRCIISLLLLLLAFGMAMPVSAATYYSGIIHNGTKAERKQYTKDTGLKNLVYDCNIQNGYLKLSGFMLNSSKATMKNAKVTGKKFKLSSKIRYYSGGGEIEKTLSDEETIQDQLRYFIGMELVFKVVKGKVTEISIIC